MAQNDADRHYFKATILLQLGRKAEASMELENAIRIQRNHYNATKMMIRLQKSDGCL
jgi:hypothetical protein